MMGTGIDCIYLLECNTSCRVVFVYLFICLFTASWVDLWYCSVLLILFFFFVVFWDEKEVDGGVCVVGDRFGYQGEYRIEG